MFVLSPTAAPWSPFPASRFAALLLMLFAAGCHCQQQAEPAPWIAYERYGGIAGEEIELRVALNGDWNLRDGSDQLAGSLTPLQRMFLQTVLDQIGEDQILAAPVEPEECCDQITERLAINGAAIDLQALPLELRQQFAGIVGTLPKTAQGAGDA